MWISKSFQRKEFACKCGCGYNTVDAGLLSLLEALRDTLISALQHPVRIKITSGCRCSEHNKIVGGAKNSLHTLGKAADIQCDKFKGTWSRIDPDYVADIADKLEANGLGRYDTFTHVDSRDGSARWDQRS